MNALIPLKNPNPAELFVPGGLDSILASIEAEARSVVPDPTTKQGLKEIGSLARKVASSKSYLDGLGKDYVAELKKASNAVDAVRREMRDRLDALRDEVRRPLTEWEQAEEKRTSEIQRRIGSMSLVGDEGTTSAEIQAGIERLIAFPVDESFQEYQGDAAKAKDSALQRLSERLAAARKAEAEAAELAEKAKREQEDRERRIAEEAAAKARQEALAEAYSTVKDVTTALTHDQPAEIPLAIDEGVDRDIEDEDRLKWVMESVTNTFVALGVERFVAELIVEQIALGMVEGLTIHY